MPPPFIAPALFDFLRELETRNERAWFETNEDRYRADVRDPMLAFIADFRGPRRGGNEAAALRRVPSGGGR